MEDLLENFADEELKDELKSRGFIVFNEEHLDIFLANCDQYELRSALEDTSGWLIYDSPTDALNDLKDDYLDEMIEIINNKSKSNLIINDHNNGIDFRKHDCKSLIEDIVRRRGWNYLYEVLYKFDS